MKKIFTLAMFATVLFYCNQANAKIRRVGYFGTPVAGTDYSDLQSAHDSCQCQGYDHVIPGRAGTPILVKKIVVLGYGYFVSGTGANANLQNITGALSAQIYLFAGADSSVYEGIDGLTIDLYGGETVNKVIVRRCNASIYLNDKIIDSLANTTIQYQ